jgi:hypothetical protein
MMPGMRGLVGALIALASCVLLAPATSLAVVATLYEDWQEGIIRSARWQGGEAFGGLEISGRSRRAASR